MLSEAERRSLDEIEQRLRTEEPDLVRAMARRWSSREWVFYGIVSLFGGLTVLLTVIGAVGAALMCLLVTSAALVWYRFPVRISELPEIK